LGAGFVGLLGDAPDEGNGVQRSGDDELLIGLKTSADTDGDFGKPVELGVEREERERGVGRGDSRTHNVRVGGGGDGCNFAVGCWWMRSPGSRFSCDVMRR
jgi:hypothetical protein